VRRAGVAGRVDLWRRSPAQKDRAEQERVPGLGRSPFRPFCFSISEFSKMSHNFGNTPNAVNNNVQVGAADDSHRPPNPWPWPHRWA
jgi:hypothetical protein